MADQRYQVIARKWRPQRFDDVVGQEHITRTLKNAIASGRIHHAFLFIGSRGIGKTTTARVLAKALNCLASDKPTTDPCGECANCVSIASGTNIDVIEIDGASNNGVDDVREIRDAIRMTPTSGRYKVYIIDEVHQLSAGAFNALLKTLEEPPPHAKFILATTEAHKVLPTIISRCQRYDFRRVSIDGIVQLLRSVLDAEGRKASDEALRAIARAAEGGVRDAESILDELITYTEKEITFQDVFDVLGLVDWKVLHDLCDAMQKKDVAKQLMLVEEVVSAGKDLTQFVQDVLRYFRNLLVVKTVGDTTLLDLPDEERQEAELRAKHFPNAELIRLVDQFAELTKGFESQLAQRIALESLLIRLSKLSTEVSVDVILEKLLELERRGLPGAPPGTANPPEAGRGTDAPPAPARTRRIQLEGETLARHWPRIVEHVNKRSLNAAIAAGQALPTALEGDTLVLSFPAKCEHARSIVEKPANRGEIEGALAQLTENVRRIRTELLEAAPEATDKGNGAQGAPVHYPAVNPEEANAALQDPRIAHVVDVFKARIIDIRRSVAPKAE